MKLTTLYNPVCEAWSVRTKLLLVMKLTTFLLLVASLHISAAGFTQTVTISKRNTSLKSVFKEIKKQTGYFFFYKAQVLQGRGNINIELKNASLTDALKASLKDQNLSFDLVNKTIVISNKEISSATQSLLAAKIEIKGVVTDKSTGETIPGVNISIKNGASIGVTNDKGEFRVSIEEGTLLVFSYVGYEVFETKVTNGKQLNIRLSSKQMQMNDVVVTGYQTIKKDNYTGNAITLKGEDLRRNNPQNLLKSIQTFDPSFKVLDNNLFGSDPNALPKINVRGATALPSIEDTDNILDRNNLSSNYNLPAFMLDGFEVTLQKVIDMDINRIESVTLLKDAAATAVYGSRAANGVIVITTKAPVAGKLQLSYNYEMSLNAPDLSDYHVLNAKDKLAYEKLAGLYDARDAAYTIDQLDAEYFNRLKNVASGVDTYWLSQALRNAYRQKHAVYIQGGDQKFRYGLDLRYETTPGVMLKSDRNRYSGAMNFTYNPSPKLLFKNEVTVTQVTSHNSPYGDFSTYVRMNPYYPKTDANGDIVQELSSWRVDTRDRGDKQFQTRYVFNPLFEGTLASFDKTSMLEIIDAFSVDWKITPSLNFKSQISLNKNQSTNDKFVSPYSNLFYDYTADRLNNKGSYTLYTDDQFTVDGKATLGYNKQIGEQYLNLVLGTNIISASTDTKLIEAQGFSNDRFTNIGFARIYKENDHPRGSVIDKRLAGAFFSGNYSYKNKYLLDASFRYEGSSSFGANKRFAPFYSTGLGWNMHKESFIEDLGFISQLRLKGSIGTVGSVQFPAYLSRSLYSYDTGNWYSTGLGAQVLGYGNSNLQWQKTNTYDAGVDLGLFQDRLVITPRYFYKLTKGTITDIDIPASTGFTTYKENLGNVSNTGFELYLTTNAYRSKDLNINVTGNIIHQKNKLVSLSNSLNTLNQKIDEYQTNPDKKAQSIPLVRYNEGQSMNMIYAVKSLGIDPQTGKELYVKKNGSITYDWDVKDIVPVADGTPKAEGNINPNITYKSFLLSLNFYFRFGGYAYNQTLVDRVENADPRFNVDSRVLNQRWIKPGDQTFFKNIADLSMTNVSSRFIEKDNLLELRSIYIGYEFKRDLIKKIGLQNLRTSMTLNDVFRSSSILMERGTNYPFARSLTVSLLASF